jgi:hypothetical protein
MVASVSADAAVTVSPLMCPHCLALQAHSDPPERMNTEQASRYTGMASATLRYYRHADIGPRSYKIGSKVIYERADLEAWVAGQRAASQRGGVVS